MNRAIATFTAVLVLLASVYQAWFGIQLPDLASSYSYADTPNSLAIALLALALPVIIGFGVLLPGRHQPLKMAISGADRRIAFRN
jgi:hypothetical protein